jgi:carbonic anhydrase
MNPDSLSGLESVRGWLKHVEPAWGHLEEVERNAGELTRHTALTHANILVQLENLRSHTYIEKAIAEGRLQVHGWFYDILSGRIEAYDEIERKFVPLIV